jgi:hypothetical protein
VRPDVDPRLEIRSLVLEAGSSCPALADMGGHKLCIDARSIDDSEPEDKRREGGRTIDGA